ncbi:MAG: winged helix-turn-helix domain-containing protein [Pseudomonadota bacterium]|nr:winged helix-turn-helix domain-containing protein [Pseudomonadota bacterium]
MGAIGGVGDANATRAGHACEGGRDRTRTPDRCREEALKDLRAFSETPVIVLSARVYEAERLEALELGADDYGEKPFGVAELIARLRVALRHAAQPSPPPDRIVLDRLVVDLDRRLVNRHGTAIHLTSKEFDLPAVLGRGAGRVLAHRHIHAAVWGPARVDAARSLRGLMGQLRGKIERDSTSPEIVRTGPASVNGWWTRAVAITDLRDW